MEQIISSLPEHHRQLLIVIRHSFRHRHFFRHIHQPVYILNRLIRLLPQFHLNRIIQLVQTRLQIQLLRFRFRNGHIRHLSGQLANVLKMLSEFVAEFTEFGFATVFEAKLEGHASDVVVEGLHVGIRTQ